MLYLRQRPCFTSQFHNAFGSVAFIILVSISVSCGNPPARRRLSRLVVHWSCAKLLPRCLSRDANELRQSGQQDWDLACSVGIFIMPRVQFIMQCLSGQRRERERGSRGSLVGRTAKSTHQRCHLALQASNQAPILPYSHIAQLLAWARFMHSSYGGPDGDFIVRRVTAELRPHRERGKAARSKPSLQTNMSDWSLLAPAAVAVAVSVVVLVVDISCWRYQP